MAASLDVVLSCREMHLFWLGPSLPFFLPPPSLLSLHPSLPRVTPPTQVENNPGVCLVFSWHGDGGASDSWVGSVGSSVVVARCTRGSNGAS